MRSLGRADDRHRSVAALVAFLVVAAFASVAPSAATAQTCERSISADVVALDQPFFWNRLGAAQPQGMIYALKRDVVAISGDSPGPGNAQLRSDKRPRPITLRMNVGDCLTINFTNWLSPSVPGGVVMVPGQPPLSRDEQPATRTASIHVIGLQLVGTIASDGSNAGTNASSLVAPGGSARYTLYGERENTYFMYSGGAIAGGEADGGSTAAGLFGAVNVEPRGAEWYRSQVTENDLELATVRDEAGKPVKLPTGHPKSDYDAVYPSGHPRAGTPILKMLHNGEIVHSDLNAVITGPDRGRFAAGTYRANPVYPDREQPFREFTAIYHDEPGAVQAFPIFNDPVFKHTLHSVRDGFAINYGAGGAGAEIVANRVGVGPMWDCVDCKYEEFFLTSWAVGDPAMVVDIPANATVAAGGPAMGARATKALFPDDPSNVHHSYLNDHVKFRILHAGPKEHHIFHLHAHQWLHTPDSDNSQYLDSQHIGPGSGFTLEIAYNGSGNRNKTAGDSIFHCHFYPHFAQGMWELWRVHDVFEPGTALDADGRPARGSRALPDAEILAGTPIPALVPMPTLPMAPVATAAAEIEWVNVGTDEAPNYAPTGQVRVTGAGNPGYPFFIPGVAGHRPPHPPLDKIVDGGLPRHVIVGGTAGVTVTRLDMSKELLTAAAVAIPEDGTPTEKAAMAFHATRFHPTATPAGAPAQFETNGLPPAPGAAFADPCRTDGGQPFGNPRLYKGASMQLDMKLNKAGWHFAQSRINILLDDVLPTQAGARAPEPLFFRANTNDCITYEHTNLVPPVYEQDDFQVRTPTDIIGQHIHLVKFDVMTADGSGNGWNYEDGTMSPGEVLERIHAINELRPKLDAPAGTDCAAAPDLCERGLIPFGGGAPSLLEAQPGALGVLGAQTTVQRWFADPVVNLAGKDRTLRTVFTHDHYGPSTHQQVGLTSSLVIEPEGSVWRDPETGAIFGTRGDGGPTSWRADILTADPSDSYREFMFQYGDFMLAYRPDGTAVNPPGRMEAGLPDLVALAPLCPGGVPRPCPEAISAEEPGTFMVNYRNEPLALRVRDPRTNSQAAGDAGDLAKAFLSNVTRADAAFNTQPSFYPPRPGAQPGDPFTPLLRVYEHDKVQIRAQVGSTEESHNVNVHGIKWLFEPSDPNSGWRNSQAMGISEHMEFVLPGLSAVKGSVPFADYLYEMGSSTDSRWNGTWGLLRAYNGGAGLRSDLLPLPSNPKGKAPNNANSPDFSGFCPRNAPDRKVNLTAVLARDVLPDGTLVYNPRPNQGGMLHDPTAILYVDDRDIDKTTGKLKAGVPVEPLILRANAGDCIYVNLTNRLPAVMPDLPGYNTLPMIVERFNNNHVAPSSQVGLHPQLLAYDVLDDDGANVGLNPIQTAGPGSFRKYKWYAGDITVCVGGQPADRCAGKADGFRVGTPVEFGATSLMPADPLKQHGKGLIGALIIEPQGATWVTDPTTRAAATVTKDGKTFREFVLLMQDDLNLRYQGGSAVKNSAANEDAEDSGQKGFNYRTEPFWKRLGFAPETEPHLTKSYDYTNVLSNSQVGGEDPVTPVFTAKAGEPVRFRFVHPGGHTRNHQPQIHGHVWQEEPYVDGSSAIGNNPLSNWTGIQQGHGPTNHFDAVLQNGAGGRFKVPGDYVYRDQPSFMLGGGLWGVFRVIP